MAGANKDGGIESGSEGVPTDVRHPIFARFFNRLAGWMEREIGDHRDELLAGLEGRVIEVGAGNGINFGHYPSSVEAVVALEPEPYLRERAEEATARAALPVEVRGEPAYPLPFEDGSFDAAVTSLVLCTIPDPAEALAEIRRVLRPGAELRFMEHVRGEEGSRKAGAQDLADRSGVWPWFAGGCHCSRDTVGTIEASGFAVERVREFALGPDWGITNPHVLGAARAPA